MNYNTRRGGVVKDFLDFSGGLNTEKPTYALEPDELADIENMDIHNPGKAESRKGYARLNQHPIADAPVRGIHEYVSPTGKRCMICACDGHLWRWIEKTKMWLPIYVEDLSSGFVVYEDSLILNGNFSEHTGNNFDHWTETGGGTNTAIQFSTDGYATATACEFISTAPTTPTGIADLPLDVWTNPDTLTNWGKWEASGDLQEYALGGGSICAQFRPAYAGYLDVTTESATKCAVNTGDTHLVGVWSGTEGYGYRGTVVLRLYASFYNAGGTYLSSKLKEFYPTETWTQRSFYIEPQDYPYGTTQMAIGARGYGQSVSTMGPPFSLLVDTFGITVLPRFNDNILSDSFAVDHTRPVALSFAVKRTSATDTAYANFTGYVKAKWYTVGDVLIQTDTLITNTWIPTYDTVSVGIAASAIPETATKMKLSLEVVGVCNSAGHGFRFTDVVVKQQSATITGEGSATYTELDVDERVRPDFADFMGHVYIAGYDKNIRLTDSYSIDYLPDYPAASKYVVVNKDRLWFAGDPEYQSSVYYTDYTAGGQYDPSFVDVYNFFDVDPDDGDIITGLATMSGGVAIFKNRSTLMLTGDVPNCYLRRVTNEVGTPCHQSIAYYRNDVVFFAGSDKGVYKFDGTNFTNLSEKIKTRMKKISNESMVFGIVFEHRYYLFCDDADSHTPYNDTCYVYDFDSKSWTVYKDVYAESAFIRKSKTKQQFIIGDARIFPSTTSGLVMYMDGTPSILDTITGASFTMTGGINNTWPGDSSNFLTELSASMPIIASASDNLLDDAAASFEDGSKGGFDYGEFCALVTNDTTQYVHGTHSLKQTCTYAADSIDQKDITALVGNVQCTASAKVKGIIGKSYRLALHDDVSGYTYGTAVTATGGWDTATVTKTFHGSATTRLLGPMQIGPAIGEACYWDAFQLELGATPSPYFMLNNRGACTCKIAAPFHAGDRVTAICAINSSWAGNDGVAHYLFDASDTASHLFRLYKHTDNKLYFEVGDKSAVTAALTTTTWAANSTHIVMGTVTATGTINIYLDGVVGTAATGATRETALAEYTYIGTKQDGSLQANAGLLCAAWDRILDDAQITTMSSVTDWADVLTEEPLRGGLVYEFLRGTTDDGEAITSYATTGDMALRGIGMEAAMRKVTTHAYSEGDDDIITVGDAADKAYETESHIFSLEATGNNRWGIGCWDDAPLATPPRAQARWEEPQLLDYSFRPTAPHSQRANLFRLKFSHTNATKTTKFAGFSILSRERRVR